MTITENLHVALMQIDDLIDDRHEAARTARKDNNDARGAYLEGEADGLSRAHRILSRILEAEQDNG